MARRVAGSPRRTYPPPGYWPTSSLLNRHSPYTIQILRQTLGRAKPSRALRTILRNASPSRSGPRFDKRGEVRSPSQPIFLKGWLSICEAYPGPILHAQPNPPRKSHRALAPPPAAAETLPAVAPALGWRLRHVADLVPTSPAGRNPDPFPHAMPFRTAIDRDPRCFVVWLSIIEPDCGARDP